MISNSRHQRASDSRSGYVLVLVVMLLFGIMAMAALVIDIGFARLTQRQMQTAVDGASLEGLRYRDSLWPEASDPSSTAFDNERRNAARITVARMFDDDLLAHVQDPFNFGAGPVVGFSGGVGPSILAASQQLTIPSPPVYKPADSQHLKLNPANQAEGDMLAGKYIAATLVHDEDADYTRTDFTPDQDRDAFLVRLRRSNEDFSSSDVASNGPALPYLFARGSLFNRGIAPGQAKLSAGIQARATGIAHLQPVVCVGAANTSLLIPGRLGLAIELADWSNATPAAPIPAVKTFPVTGDTIGEEVPTTSTVGNSGDGYIAIFRTSDRRVIGFGHALVDSNGMVSKLSTGAGPNQIAHENAAAVFCYRHYVSGALLASVIADNRALVSRDDILLAPVSGR